jgi:hypothetical protein
VALTRWRLRRGCTSDAAGSQLVRYQLNGLAVGVKCMSSFEWKRSTILGWWSNRLAGGDRDERGSDISGMHVGGRAGVVIRRGYAPCPFPHLASTVGRVRLGAAWIPKNTSQPGFQIPEESAYLDNRMKAACPYLYCISLCILKMSITASHTFSFH